MKTRIGGMVAAVFLAAAITVLSIPAAAHTATGEPMKNSAATEQLETWSRALRDRNPSSAYASLSTLASAKKSGELSQRAALALGYYDFSKGNYVKARAWLDKAEGDPLLEDYILYWRAETDRALKNDPQAIAALKRLRRDFPDSVMTEQALESLGESALAAAQPQEILDALAAYSPTETKPDLLVIRARAREAAGQFQDAARDYLAVAYKFPTSTPAHEAASKADFLRAKLGADFPVVPLDTRVARAEALYTSKEWYQARDAYIDVLSQLTGADRERANLRIAQCRVALGAPLSALTDLTISDPESDAERLYSISQSRRGALTEAPLLAAVDSITARAPKSRWAEYALFAAGNYYWVQLDRDRAASYYSRVADNFPGSADAGAANWRVVWTAYLERKPEVGVLLQQQLERFPNSAYITDNLYWLGRDAEKSGDTGLARAYFGKLRDRFPQTYFGGLSRDRLQALGGGQVTPVEALNRILPAPPVMAVGDTIPDAAANRQARADSLRSIAFDSSAELELRAAYAATGEPRLLLEAAQAAAKAGHYAPSMATARLIYPGLEARRFEDVPRDVWVAAFPLPYEKALRAAAAHANVDPMLVAGLTRQESAWEANVVSHANAYGLMQLLPKTARLLARQMRVSYSRARLTDPEYNLRLGTVYLAGLIKTWGSVEAALAAYNAGEDRVGSWKAGQNFAEAAEFVDTIPFTETREYVQIVLRNAAIYRRLYPTSGSGQAATAPPAPAKKPSRKHHP
jgi:soluble lytic murein transglycosylase